MENVPLGLVFIVTVTVVALLAVAAYNLVNAIQVSDWAWPWQRRRRKPVEQFTEQASIAANDFVTMAEAVGEALVAIKGLIENELRWRDWFDGVEIRWWRPGVPLIDGEWACDRIAPPPPVIYDREEDPWPY